MRKILLSLVALFICAVNVKAGDVLFKTLTFPDGNSEEISAYTKTWTATMDGLTWTIANFNNNKNGWSYIKCGRKDNASVGTITTPQIAEKVTKFVVTIDALKTAANVNATYIEVASDETFTQDVQKQEVTIAQGEIEYSVPAPKENQYYRITFDCAAASANGVVQISRIDVYKYDASSVSAPKFSISSGTLYEAQIVEVTAPAGDVYYSFDGENFTKYSVPLEITETTTVYAYAEQNGVKSNVVSATYTMATSYASISDLLQVTPSTEGVPVVFPIVDEAIQDFDNPYGTKQGVFLAREVGGKYFELYGKGLPETWNVGDKLSGTVKGYYKIYNDVTEVAVATWDGITAGAATVQAPVIAFDEATKTVTITDPSGENNTIYYTLDGSDPDDSAIQYEGPFTIEQTTNVKAICYNDDDAKSGVTAYMCTIEAGLESIAGLLAGCTATSQNDAPEVTFNMTDVLVTGVAGSNVFISDATGTFLLYGSGSGLKKGDKIAGSVKGKLYSYNGLPELSVSDKWANVNKVSEDNEVALTIMKAADVTVADASKYVAFENVKFVSQDASGKHITYTFDQDGFQFNLFDNFDVLNDMTFSASDAYTYTLRVYVIPYKDVIQYYAVSADDISEYSNKEKAVLTFDNFADNQLFSLAKTQSVGFSCTVVSDAPQIDYETSDADVATIAFGQINFVGPGVATVSMSVAETEYYSAAKDSRTVRVWSGAAGEFKDAYCVGDVKALFVDGDTLKNVWVKAYIVGSAKSNMNSVIFGNGEGTQATNLVVAAKADETDAAKCLPVELPKGNMRTALNLVDNPDNLGKQVWLNGNIIKYMSVAGLKGVADYSFDGKTPSSIDNIKIDDQSTFNGIYNLAGQKVDASFKGIVIVNGKKYLNK